MHIEEQQGEGSPPPWMNDYFLRCRSWDWQGPKSIGVLDDSGRVTATLDDWQTMVFFYAEGNRTVADFIVWLEKRFVDDAAQMRQIALFAIGFLLENNFIVLSRKVDSLPYFYDLPVRDQDPREVIKARAEDEADRRLD